MQGGRSGNVPGDRAIIGNPGGDDIKGGWNVDDPGENTRMESPVRADVMGGRSADAPGDRVTCAMAGDGYTVLGTDSGRVLFAGNSGCRLSCYVMTPPVLGGFFEFGRLPDGLRCWSVQRGCLRHSGVQMVLVIDCLGQVHAVCVVGCTELSYPVRVAPQGAELETNNYSCLGGIEGDIEDGMVDGSVDDVVDHVEYDRGSVFCGGGVSVDEEGGDGSEEGLPSLLQPQSQRSTIPPPPAAAATKCSAVFVSPCRANDDGKLVSLALDGDAGWGVSNAFVGISDEGNFVVSAEVGPGHDLKRRRRKGVDGVVCAVLWVEQQMLECRGLMVADGGASLLTWGNARAGHVRGIPCWLLLLLLCLRLSLLLLLV